MLKANGFKVIVVSNQPSYAKGKTTLKNIQTIERLLCDFSEENGGLIDGFYYCYHHPDGIVPEYSGECKCRKPGTMFIEDAIGRLDLDAHKCWFVGDRDTDIQCGKAMGFSTIMINNKHSMNKSGNEKPTCFADTLLEATVVIINY